MAILLLAILEARCGNIAQRDLHRQALGKLIARRGGLETVEDYVRSSILRFEFFWAIETGDTAIESLHTSASQTTRKLAVATICERLLDELPLGFQALAKHQLLSLNAVHEIIRTNQFEKREYGEPPTPSSGLLPSIDNSSTHRDYWEVCPDLLARYEDESTISALICLGLLLFNSLAFAELSVWDTRFLWTKRITSVRNDLIRRLLQCQRRRGFPEEFALIWVFSVTIGACRLVGKKDLSTDGHNLAIFAYNRFSDWMRYSEGPRILRDFFYHDGICFDIAGAGPASPVSQTRLIEWTPGKIYRRASASLSPDLQSPT